MPALLEREAEISSLVATVTAAETGEGRFVLIAGEAGAGKTSLVAELRRHVAVVSGYCEPLSVPAPLAPLRELTPGRAEFDADDRVALAIAIRDELTASGPGVAVVEDAHWADPATLDVLRALARRIEHVPLAFVVTYRDDELRSNAALATFVGDLATAPRVTRIRLAPLSSAAVRAIAEPAGADADEVMRLTSGNPFLVAEAVAAPGELPATVREATLARVTRLSGAARAVVEAAAVLGARVRLDVLRRVEPHAPDALDGAVGSGVLIEEGNTLVFRHELTRQAIELELSRSRTNELHARALEALAADGDAALLAHHAERAGRIDDAARYAEQAAREAERIGALAEASRQLERALRVASDPEARFELLLRYVRATNFAGGLEQARASALDAVELAERHLDGAAVGRALVVLSWSLWSLDRVVEARDAAARAVAALTPDANGDYVAAVAAELRIESIAFDAGVVVRDAPAAIELARRLAADESRIDISISLGLARSHLREPDALSTLIEALHEAKSLRLTFQTIRAYVNTVDVAVESRSHALVDRLSTEALRELDTFQTSIPFQTVQLGVARSLLQRGRFDEAVGLARAARREQHGNVPIALALEGIVAERCGGDGRELLEAGWEQLTATPAGWRQAVVQAWRIEAAWLRGSTRSREPVSASGRVADEVDMWNARVAGQWRADWRQEVERWRVLDSPYDAALAALPGDEGAATSAVAVLRRLGADRAARAFLRERRRLGYAEVRGPRPTTLANPAGLTVREQEILSHLALGTTNGGIAAALHLSERTVAHHVSAILSKLDASNRTAAVEAGRRIGILQDGNASAPT